MSLLYLYVVTVSLFSLGRTQNRPGIVTVLSESLFEKEAKQVFDDLEDELVSAANLRRISGKNGRLSWELYRINVYHFDGPKTTVDIGSPARDPLLTFELEGGTIKTRFHWWATYDAWFRDFTIDGTADARLYGVDMTKSVALGITAGKTLRLESENCGVTSCCDLSIEDMTISVAGNVISWIINKVIGLFYGNIEDLIKEEACQRINQIIHSEVNDKLSSRPLRTTIISHGLHLNYSLETLDHVGDCLVVGVHGGVTPAGEETDMTQWAGAQLPESECVEVGYHFSTRISHNTIQSLVAAIHRAGQFTYFNIGNDKILAAGAMFRPGFFARAEDELMQHYILKMFVNITAVPQTSINTTSSCIEVRIPASLNLMMVHPNEHRSNKFLLKLETEFVVGLKLAVGQIGEDVVVQGNVIHASATVLNITVNKSRNFTLSSAQSLVELVSAGIIRPLVTKQLDQGILTNFGSVFSVETSVLEYHENYVEIDGIINEWNW